MTVNHDAVAALPTTGQAVKSLLRSVLVARMPYVLADSEDSRNLVATDSSTGAVIVDMLLLGRVFHYDPTDTTTAHDGTSCLVSSDGLRYKLAVGTDVFAYAVLDNAIATPPVSPTLGDSYLVAAAATGAWSGKSNYIAVKTSRGWEFVNFSIGRFIYVESVDTYYHKNAGGSWVTGFGNQVTTPNSVPLSAAINFGKRLIVENQTTTSPPGSPTVGTAYIIGPSATGGWSGLDAKIAICEVAGSFVVYTPTKGWAAYDKNIGTAFEFNGSAWTSTIGAWVNFTSVKAAGTSIGTTQGSSSWGGWTPSSFPTTTAFARVDDLTISYTAKKASATIRLRYHASVNFAIPGGATVMTLAVFIDSIATCLDFTAVPVPINFAQVDAEFILTTPADTLPHTYKMALVAVNNANGANDLSRRTISIEELAS